MNYTEESAIKTKAVGAGSENNLTLLNQLFEWLRESEGAPSEENWRTVSTEDYKFYAGKQDEDEVLTELIDKKRPTHVFNTILPKVNMLVGLASQSNRTPYAFPVGTEDKSLADLINPALKHYRKVTKTKEKEDECFEHMVKSGRSFLYFYIDNSNPFKPQMKVRRLPGRDVRIDPISLEYDLSDARYIFIDRWFTEKEMELNWPDVDAATLKSMSSAMPRPLFYNMIKDLYRVVECWYRKTEMVVWFVNPFTNKPEWLKESDFKQMVKVLKSGIPLPNGQTLQYDRPIESVRKPKTMIYYAIFTGTAVLEEGVSPHKFEGFPVVLFGAYKDEDENRWFSVIQMMKDPQSARNQMRRQLLHLLQTSPKGILLHEVDSIINEDEYDKKSSEPNFRLVVKKGGLETVRFTNQPQISPVYDTLDRVFEQDVKDVSGIQDPLMGIQTSSREPGVTMRMRQESSLAVLFILFNNFKLSRLQSGKITLSFIQQYVTTPEIIRIEGQEGIATMQINTQMNPEVDGFNDITANEYDLTIEEAMDSPTIRMAVAQLLTDFANNNPNTIPPDMILEFSDLPITVIKRVQEYHAAMLEREERMQERDLENQRQLEAMRQGVKLESEGMKNKNTESKNKSGNSQKKHKK